MRTKKVFAAFLLCLFALTGIAFADNKISGVPVIDQDIFEATLRLDNICGPTTFAEIAGFWGTRGYQNLLRGPLSGQVPDTSVGMYELFDEAMDYSGRDSVGRTYPTPFSNGMADYFYDNGYDVEVTHWKRGAMTWNDLTAELDAGRPVALCVWSLYHWVVAVGYTDVPKTLTILCGYVPLVRTLTYYQMPRQADIEAVFVRPSSNMPEPPPPPPVEPDPNTEQWYQDVMNWCKTNGWELEPAD